MENLKHEIKDTKGCGKRCHASRLMPPRVSGLTSHAQWPKVKLGDAPITIIDGDRGKNYPKQNELFASGYCLFLSAENVTRQGFRFDSNKFITIQKDSVLRNGKLARFDIILTTRGTLGNVALYGSSVPFENVRINSGMLILRCDTQKLLPNFLLYVLRSEDFISQVNGFKSGVAQPQLPIKDLKQIQIPLPPLPIQRRIADVLSAYDDLIENNRRRIAILEETARLTYRKWFGGMEQSKTATLGEVCQTFGGGTPKTSVPEFWNGDIPWVVPTDITRNTCLSVLDTERKITELGLEKSSTKMLPANAILMTSRASVGYFGIADFPVCTNQGFISIVPNNDSWRWYLLFNLMLRVEEIRSNAKGSTFPEISRARFRSMNVAIPDDNALIEFNRAVEPLMQQVRILAKQSADLAAARDMLLPRLMKGFTN